MLSWRTLRSALIVVSVCWVVFFWRLGHIGLMDDEAHYARLTQDMAAEGDWMVPRLSGEPLLDKPVFFHWVQGVTTAAVADSELAVRLPSALAAMALLGLLAWLGTVSAGREAGRAAWIALATVPATFLLARTGFMDMLFTALLFGAVALITRSMISRSIWAQAAAVLCLTLAILTKGPIAAGLIGLWLGALWLWRGASRQTFANLNLWLCALGVCALAVPWFLWMYLRFGDLFVTTYLGAGHVDYLSPRNSASSRQWSFYLRMFMTSFFPWSFIAVGYGIDTVRRRWRRGVPVPTWEIGLWVWMAVVMAVFTLVPFRVDRYIYPVAPSCCLLAVRGWLAASAETRWREFAATRAAVGIVALIFVIGGVAVWKALPTLAIPLPTVAFLLPLVMVIGGGAMAMAMIRRGAGLPRLAGWPTVTPLAVYAFIVVVGLPIIRAGLPVEQLGRFVADQTNDGAPVAVLGLDRLESGLAYYLNKPPQHLRDAVDVERFAKKPGPRWVIARRAQVAQFPSGGCVTYSVPAIVGTTGRGIRTQVWGEIVVLRYNSVAEYVTAACLP